MVALTGTQLPRWPSVCYVTSLPQELPALMTTGQAEEVVGWTTLTRRQEPWWEEVQGSGRANGHWDLRSRAGKGAFPLHCYQG